MLLPPLGSFPDCCCRRLDRFQIAAAAAWITSGSLPPLGLLPPLSSLKSLGSFLPLSLPLGLLPLVSLLALLLRCHHDPPVSLFAIILSFKCILVLPYCIFTILFLGRSVPCSVVVLFRHAVVLYRRVALPLPAATPITAAAWVAAATRIAAAAQIAAVARIDRCYCLDHCHHSDFCCRRSDCCCHSDRFCHLDHLRRSDHFRRSDYFSSSDSFGQLDRFRLDCRGRCSDCCSLLPLGWLPALINIKSAARIAYATCK